MVNWPLELRRLYKKHSIPKRFRLHFPNGERPDILNENIEEESMVIHQRLCSQERLKFGMCEAATMECNVFDIEQKWIIDENGNRVRNPNPLRGNIKGCEVEVIQEIDISSCSSNFIAEYGKTAEDVPWPYFEVSFGKFTIESCQKTANTDTRKLTGFDALNSSVMDKSLAAWAEMYYNPYLFTGIIEDSYFQTSKNLNDILVSIILYNRIPLANSAENSILLKDEVSIFEGVGMEEGQSVPSNSKITNNIPEPYYAFNEWCGTKNKVNIPKGDYYCSVEYDRDEIQRMGEYLESLGADYRTVDELIADLNHLVVIGSTKTPGQNYLLKYKYLDAVSKNIVSGRLTSPGGMYNVAFLGGVTVTKYVNLYGMTPYGSNRVPVASFKTIKSIQLIPCNRFDEIIDTKYPVELFNTAWDHYGEMPIPAEEFTVRNLAGAILEINGLFGVMTADGMLIRKLDKSHWELSERWRLESEWELNGFADTIVEEGTQEEAWYDEDVDIGIYRTVQILKDSETVVAKYTGTSGSMVYSIENNPLISYLGLSEVQMADICKKLHAKICTSKWAPVFLGIMSRPYLEVGDRVAFYDDGMLVSTYIFDKVISGIVSMKDEIDSSLVIE